MQSKQRFGELHNVCFNEENYPFDIYQNLRPLREQKHIRETPFPKLPMGEVPDDIIEYQNISNEVKQHFEKNISPIESKDFNGISTAYFSNNIIGNWYLKEINENSFVGYFNAIPNGGWKWSESAYSLKYKESEIVYCIMQKLSKYYKQNNKFELEFNKYKAFFDGTLEEFLECLMNEYEDFSFFTGAGTYYFMNKIEGYDGLKDKLTEKVNNLSTPPAPEEIEQENDTFDFNKEIEILMESENKFCKGLPMHFVINHFKVFYENNRGTEYLSKESFASFIKRGFLNDDTQLIQNINFKRMEKGLVISIFYDFFDIADRKYNYPRKKLNFINLIKRCFDNLGTFESIKSYMKPNKTGQSW